MNPTTPERLRQDSLAVPGISEQLAEFFRMSESAKVHVRHRMIAAAYTQLPDLTPEERTLAHDRLLAAKCSEWRIRFREMEKDRDGLRRRVGMLELECRIANAEKALLEQAVASLSTQLSTELPPEFTGVSTTG